MLSRDQVSPFAVNSAIEAMTPINTDRLLSLPIVLHITSLSKTKLYADIRGGRFPAPVKLGPKKSAWRTSDIQKWLSSRATARMAA